MCPLSRLETCSALEPVHAIWGFPKTRGTILGVFIIRTIVLGGLHWGPPILGNYHIGIMEKKMETSM